MVNFLNAHIYAKKTTTTSSSLAITVKIKSILLTHHLTNHAMRVNRSQHHSQMEDSYKLQYIYDQ